MNLFYKVTAMLTVIVCMIAFIVNDVFSLITDNDLQPLGYISLLTSLCFTPWFFWKGIRKVKLSVVFTIAIVIHFVSYLLIFLGELDTIFVGCYSITQEFCGLGGAIAFAIGNWGLFLELPFVLIAFTLYYLRQQYNVPHQIQ